MSTEEHKADAPRSVRVAIISVSTTRSLAEDKSGHWIGRQAIREGHRVVSHVVVPDEVGAIREALDEARRNHAAQVILVTGGTGISRLDVTIEAVRPLFDKELTSFGILFTQLSFDEIDSAAMLSRATAGIVGDGAVFCMPGSLKACKLACRELIFPELGHLVRHLTRG